MAPRHKLQMGLKSIILICSKMSRLSIDFGTFHRFVLPTTGITMSKTGTNSVIFAHYVAHQGQYLPMCDVSSFNKPTAVCRNVYTRARGSVGRRPPEYNTEHVLLGDLLSSCSRRTPLSRLNLQNDVQKPQHEKRNSDVIYKLNSS
jgi:hypothetical protein